MEKQYLTIRITYLDEVYSNKYEFEGDYLPVVDYAEEEWYNEVGSKIPDFNWDYYEMQYGVPVPKERLKKILVN